MDVVASSMPEGVSRQQGDMRVGREKGRNSGDSGMGHETDKKGFMRVDKGGIKLSV